MKILIRHLVCGCAAIGLIAGCSTTGSTNATSSVSQRETLLTNAGFKQLMVTTDEQKADVAKLATDKVSAVKYHGKLYYVFPTMTKNLIYAGRQKQFDAYKASLKAYAASRPAHEGAHEQAVMRGDVPDYAWETAGPYHIAIEEFRGPEPIGVDPTD